MPPPANRYAPWRGAPAPEPGSDPPAPRRRGPRPAKVTGASGQAGGAQGPSRETRAARIGRLEADSCARVTRAPAGQRAAARARRWVDRARTGSAGYGQALVSRCRTRPKKSRPAGDWRPSFTEATRNATSPAGASISARGSGPAHGPAGTRERSLPPATRPGPRRPCPPSCPAPARARAETSKDERSGSARACSIRVHGPARTRPPRLLSLPSPSSRTRRLAARGDGAREGHASRSRSARGRWAGGSGGGGGSRSWRARQRS